LILIAVLTILHLFAKLAWAHDDTYTSRYIANEGILVSHGDIKIIFDAFYADSHGSYRLAGDKTRSALLSGRLPFDGVFR